MLNVIQLCCHVSMPLQKLLTYIKWVTPLLAGRVRLKITSLFNNWNELLARINSLTDHLTTWLLYFSNSNSSPIVLWKRQQKSYLCINIWFSTPRIVRYFSSIWCLRTIQCSSSHSRWKFNICTLLTPTKQVERNDSNTCKYVRRSLIMSRVKILFDYHFL